MIDEIKSESDPTALGESSNTGSSGKTGAGEGGKGVADASANVLHIFMR
jgi:hypothetical protein